MNEMNDKWLPLAEAAKVAKVSVSTLRRLVNCQTGGVHAPRIPHARVGSAGRRAVDGRGGLILIQERVARALAKNFAAGRIAHRANLPVTHYVRTNEMTDSTTPENTPAPKTDAERNRDLQVRLIITELTAAAQAAGAPNPAHIVTLLKPSARLDDDNCVVVDFQGEIMKAHDAARKMKRDRETSYLFNTPQAAPKSLTEEEIEKMTQEQYLANRSMFVKKRPR
jgi:hypothetical protein